MFVIKLLFYLNLYVNVKLSYKRIACNLLYFDLFWFFDVLIFIEIRFNIVLIRHKNNLVNIWILMTFSCLLKVRLHTIWQSDNWHFPHQPLLFRKRAQWVVAVWELLERDKRKIIIRLMLLRCVSMIYINVRQLPV
jgi:hypothetical protein